MGRRADQGGWPSSGFGVRLRAIREAAGLTMHELAESTMAYIKHGIAVSTINKLELGLQEPGWPLVLAVARALGRTPNSFLPRGWSKRKE